MDDPEAALDDVLALHRMQRSPQPVEIHVGRTRLNDINHPGPLIVALATASQDYGHVLHIVGVPGNVRFWWDAIHREAKAVATERPELRVVDGGQPRP